ncbi:hypothetical protein KKG45_00875, partial [bacterium]|nr:hypothetical protein [bacterium]MBU1071778.1 hypothetical protein [bacterium]MBU1674542.1 hypothetical protein [bacterium]
MKQLVNTTALAAAFAAICFALFRDYGLLATLKRAAIAYFAFYGVGAILVMIFRAGIQDDWIREDWARRQARLAAEETKRAETEAARLDEMKRRKAERKQHLIGEKR